MIIRVLAFILMVVLAGCQDRQPSNSPVDPAVHTYTASIGKAEERSLPVIYSVPGTIVAKNNLQVASRITGYIDHIDVDEGDLVEPGAVLVQIDGAQIEAAIRGLESAIVAARAEFQDARGDLKRFRTLSKTQALAEDQIRDALVRQTKAEAALAQAQAALDAKQQDLRHIHLTSPVRALVRERLLDRGDLATAGKPILQLDVLNTMELEVYLSSSQIGSISKGQNVDVFIQSDAEPITGEVTRIVRSADSATRRSKVRIALPDSKRLSPGLFARTHILLGHKAALTVPDSAIVERAGIEGVFAVTEDGTARFRSIRAGKHWQGYREVLAGVDAGLSVVLNPSHRLKDGDRIKRIRTDGA
jgi:RND family efflux transporter MFP subunit